MAAPRLLLFLLAALLIAAAAPRSGEPAASARVRGHVEFLASDRLEGRGTGSAGHAAAANYVADQFRALGLTPGGPSGSWLMKVPLRRSTHAAPARIVFNLDGNKTELSVGKDAAVRPSLLERRRTIDAGLVFVGYGISSPALRIDDYAGVDAKGNIAVIMAGTPYGLPREIGTHLSSLKDQFAARNGAIGLIELPANASAWLSSAKIDEAGQPLLDWVDASGSSGPGSLLRVKPALSADWSARLFHGAAKSLRELQALASKGAQLPAFALRGRLAIDSASDWQDFTSDQVIGILPGSDERLARDHVLMLAHLDHLGVDELAERGKDTIFNGALDNAAGVAVLIEAARSLANAPRPRRSIAFVATTGEERGLLGADYLAAHPIASLATPIAVVNLDMPLLLYDFRDVVAFGANRSTIDKSVAAAARSMVLTVSPDPMPEQTLFLRSDHFRFVLRGIPAAFLMTGHRAGGKKAWQRFLSKNYHRPSDDLKQGFNWRSGARFAELNARIAHHLADRLDPPLWYQGDYFGDAFAPSALKAKR